jgi:hypothetical protein
MYPHTPYSPIYMSLAGAFLHHCKPDHLSGLSKAHLSICCSPPSSNDPLLVRHNIHRTHTKTVFHHHTNHTNHTNHTKHQKATTSVSRHLDSPGRVLTASQYQSQLQPCIRPRLSESIVRRSLNLKRTMTEELSYAISPYEESFLCSGSSSGCQSGSHIQTMCEDRS